MPASSFSVPVRSFGFMRRASSVPPRVFLSTVLAQVSGCETHGWMIRIYHHTSQLRANSERATLNFPSVSGHRLLLCASLLVFSYLPLGRCCCRRCRVSRFVILSAQTPLSGAAPLFSSAAALLSLCVEAAVMCRRRPAARNSPPGPPSRPVAVAFGPQWVLLFVLLIGISKAVVLLGLRLRSPPVASGRLRSSPVASGRLRSPPVVSGHLRSTSLAKHKRDAPGVGSGGAWVGFGGSWGIVSAHEYVLGIKQPGVTSARAYLGISPISARIETV